MSTSKSKFTFKIILSYLVLGALAVLMGVFVYSEFKNYTAENVESTGEEKFIETGTLINLVFETDGFSRLALLSETDEDFEKYMSKTDSLFKKIEEIKSLTNNAFQIKQLDSVKTMLEEKNRNIEQLRILRLTNKKDTSLDDILKEVRKLEASIGMSSVESLVKNPSRLSKQDRKIWESYAEYLNSISLRETATVKSKTVDSMLTASRYIVAEAKKENSRIRQSLMQKENELIRNDLNISGRLREIIGSFDREITKNHDLEKQSRDASVARTGQILRIAAIIGGIVIVLFSYFILSDFFRAERFKKNLEESKNYAESLLKSREQLISTVSHDLKTPLNTITGYSELFENSTLSEKQKYYLGQITSSSHFISHLVDDLLDYSKLEAGKLPLEAVPFSLENIIVQAGNAAKQLHLEKAVSLKITISEKIKDKIFESDPLRIRQIINNLVGNAFKFTAVGSVEIKVEEIERQDNISTVQISIIDTGIGISEEKQDFIFQEFTQAEMDIAHKFGGSGLGLAISKKLAHLLGGTLQVSSILGKGSTFTFILPLKNSERVLQKRAVEKPKSFLGLKAVIIDDDEAMRALLKEIFEQMDITSEVFGTFENFRSSENTSFDFLLTDIQMPGIDGFSILKKMKLGEINSYKTQPIIAMTGSREHPKEYYLAKGFSEMLSKPFSKYELISVLEGIFSRNKAFSSENPKSRQIQNRTSEKFDLSMLQSFVNTPQAMDEILSVFFTQTEADLVLLKNSIENNDFITIQETAHRMLTMFRQIQATNVIPLLERMENYKTQKMGNNKMNMDYEKLVLNVKDLTNDLQKERSL